MSVLLCCMLAGQRSAAAVAGVRAAAAGVHVPVFLRLRDERERVCACSVVSLYK